MYYRPILNNVQSNSITAWPHSALWGQQPPERLWAASLALYSSMWKALERDKIIRDILARLLTLAPDMCYYYDCDILFLQALRICDCFRWALAWRGWVRRCLIIKETWNSELFNHLFINIGVNLQVKGGHILAGSAYGWSWSLDSEATGDFSRLRLLPSQRCAV